MSFKKSYFWHEEAKEYGNHVRKRLLCVAHFCFKYICMYVCVCVLYDAAWNRFASLFCSGSSVCLFPLARMSVRKRNVLVRLISLLLFKQKRKRMKRKPNEMYSILNLSIHITQNT